MKINKKRSNMIKNVLVAYLLFICIGSSFASETYFPQSANNAPFESNENYSTPGEAFGTSKSYYPGLAYTPFQSENFQPLQSGPVLYGPGGDPIGGIPAGDGVHFLFFTVVGYCIFKAIRKQKMVKNLYKQ